MVRVCFLKVCAAGVDWNSVHKYVTVDTIFGHFMDPSLPPGSGQSGLLRWPALAKLSKGRSLKPVKKSLSGRTTLVEENGTVNTAEFFGRTKGWGGPYDLENVFSEEGTAVGSSCVLLGSVVSCTLLTESKLARLPNTSLGGCWISEAIHQLFVVSFDVGRRKLSLAQLETSEGTTARGSMQRGQISGELRLASHRIAVQRTAPLKRLQAKATKTRASRTRRPTSGHPSPAASFRSYLGRKGRRRSRRAPRPLPASTVLRCCPSPGTQWSQGPWQQVRALWVPGSENPERALLAS